MTFVLFLIVLGVLVFVHELGHFLIAKKAGVRVDEFGFGYPPRALILGKKWGTVFTLNWIPFGGFVKIFGENYDDDLIEKEEQKHTVPALSHKDNALGTVISVPLSFTQISKKWQAAILSAGVIFNILFAWLLFSIGFVIGVPTSVDNDYGAIIQNSTLTIIEVIPDSPAQKVGLKSGDKIISISSSDGEIIEKPASDYVSSFINQSEGEIVIQTDRGGKILTFKVTPEKLMNENKKIIGISMDMVGIVSLPVHKAIYEGGKTTIEICKTTIIGISNLIVEAVRGKADLSQVAGPVGIVGLVGDASRLGFAYLITFTALISINLAIINLVPFPALDGGRILVVAIEGITRKKINVKAIHTINTIGFFLLIALMVIITYRDVLKLF